MPAYPPDPDPLIEALVGEKHQRAYLVDPEFHAQVDNLVQFLPQLVDSIAETCKGVAERRRHMLTSLMDDPSLGDHIGDIYSTRPQDDQGPCTRESPCSKLNPLHVSLRGECWHYSDEPGGAVMRMTRG